MTERLFVQLDDDPSSGVETGAPAGTFRAFPVAAPLREYVSSLLLYRETLPPGHVTLERVVPDGVVRLAFNLGDAPTVGDAAGHAVEAIGASMAPAIVRLRGRVEGLSVALRPGAAAALLGLPAGEIVGTAVPLDAVWGSAGTELLERVALARDDTARAALIAGALVRRLAHRDDGPRRIAVRAAQLIAASDGRAAVRDVAAKIGIGERRLQQLFHAHVGLAPRSWGRLARLRACLRMLRAQAVPRWADIAADGGFYDQAHLVNEFRALCGLTPTEYVGSLRRDVAGSSNTRR